MAAPVIVAQPNGPITSVQNQVYTTPGRSLYHFLFADGATWVASNDAAFGTSVSLTNGTDLARMFFKCTSGNGVFNLVKSG
jgi:hypothetical protein